MDVCTVSVSLFVTEVKCLLGLTLSHSSFICSLQCWLDPTKEIKRQIRSTFYFSNQTLAFFFFLNAHWKMYWSPSIPCHYFSLLRTSLAIKCVSHNNKHQLFSQKALNKVYIVYWINKIWQLSPYQIKNKLHHKQSESSEPKWQQLGSMEEVTRAWSLCFIIYKSL